MQVPAPSTDLQRTQGLDVLSQRTGRSASPAAAWPCLAGAGGTACLGSDAAAQACHCPLEGTPRWENGFKSAPLPSSAGQLSMTQQSRSRAISRGICPRCHGWTGAWVTSIHPGIDEGPPPRPRHSPRPERDGPPPHRQPSVCSQSVTRRIPWSDAGLMRGFVRFPAPPPPDPAEAISFQQERHAPGPFSYDSEV